MNIDKFKSQMRFNPILEKAKKGKQLVSKTDFLTDDAYKCMIYLYEIFSDARFSELSFEGDDIDDELKEKILVFKDYDEAGVLHKQARAYKDNFKDAFSEIFSQVIDAVERKMS